MVAYADVFDHRDKLRNPFLASLMVHLLVLGGLGGWTWYLATRPHETIGDPNATGGVTVSVTDAIPMVQRPGPVNPVANDTESQVPDRKQTVRKRVEPDDPDAVAIERLKKKKPVKKLTEFEQRILDRQRQMAQDDLKSNQVYSTTGRAAVSPMFSQTSTGAGVGVGTGNPFGTRFGWYGQLITQRIAEKWRTQQIEASVRSANVCSVAFRISKDGSVKDVQVVQRSGTYQVDISAQRAVLEASPFPPLPDGFGKDTATVEINFQFKR